MAKLTIVIGMGGSGKSFLCSKIARTSGAFAFEDATLTKDNRRRAGHGCLGEIVARLLGRNEDCVMDESHLTDTSFRDAFRDFCDEFLSRVEQEWIFFERDVVACINNTFEDARNGRVEACRLKALDHQSKVYKVPAPHEFPRYTGPRSVYQCTNPKFDNEADALKWLSSEIASRCMVSDEARGACEIAPNPAAAVGRQPPLRSGRRR